MALKNKENTNSNRNGVNKYERPRNVEWTFKKTKPNQKKKRSKKGEKTKQTKQVYSIEECCVYPKVKYPVSDMT